MNYRTLKNHINKMGIGEMLYINVINLSENGVNLIRDYIKSGILIPDKAEVEQLYKDIENVMNGNVILPQLNYRRA